LLEGGWRTTHKTRDTIAVCWLWPVRHQRDGINFFLFDHAVSCCFGCSWMTHSV
jgi:hypothetical protein